MVTELLIKTHNKKDKYFPGLRETLAPLQGQHQRARPDTKHSGLHKAASWICIWSACPEKEQIG